MPRLINLQRACLFYWRIYCSSNNCQRVSLVNGLVLLCGRIYHTGGSISRSTSWQSHGGGSCVTKSSTWILTLGGLKGNTGSSFLGARPSLLSDSDKCEWQAVGVNFRSPLETNFHGFEGGFRPARRGVPSFWTLAKWRVASGKKHVEYVESSTPYS